jgi:hypothetical protein
MIKRYFITKILKIMKIKKKLVALVVTIIILFGYYFKNIKYVYYINNFSEKYWICYINGKIWSKYNRFSHFDKYEILQKEKDSLYVTDSGEFRYHFEQDSIGFFGKLRIHTMSNDTLRFLMGPSWRVQRVDTLIFVAIPKPKNISKKKRIYYSL